MLVEFLGLISLLVLLPEVLLLLLHVRLMLQKHEGKLRFAFLI